jgi:hypothetical protein
MHAILVRADTDCWEQEGIMVRMISRELTGYFLDAYRRANSEKGSR